MKKLKQNGTKKAEIRKKLNPRQRKFALEYALTGNATRSARVAGYSERSADGQGTRMSRNEDITEYLDVLAAEREDEHRAIFGTVVDRVNAVIVRAETRTPPDEVTALKGLDQLAKLGRLYERDAHKPDVPVWTGVELDFGDGVLRVVTGTGSDKPADIPVARDETNGNGDARHVPGNGRPSILESFKVS